MTNNQWRAMQTAPRDGSFIFYWDLGYAYPEVIYYHPYETDLAAEFGQPGYWAFANELMANTSVVPITTSSLWHPVIATPGEVS